MTTRMCRARVSDEWLRVSSRGDDDRGARNPRTWVTLAALAAGLATAQPATAADPCVRPICRDDYRFNGERCESGPAPITLARSHYYPKLPLCPRGGA